MLMAVTFGKSPKCGEISEGHRHQHSPQARGDRGPLREVTLLEPSEWGRRELLRTPPTLEDVKQAMRKRNQMLIHDQKVNEWMEQERERSRKSDQERIEWLERELKRSRKRDERE